MTRRLRDSTRAGGTFGYRAPPTVAVRQAFGIDLDDPHLLDDATAFLKARLDAYDAPLPER